MAVTYLTDFAGLIAAGIGMWSLYELISLFANIIPSVKASPSTPGSGISTTPTPGSGTSPTPPITPPPGSGTSPTPPITPPTGSMNPIPILQNMLNAYNNIKNNVSTVGPLFNQILLDNYNSAYDPNRINELLRINSELDNNSKEFLKNLTILTIDYSKYQINPGVEKIIVDLITRYTQEILDYTNLRNEFIDKLKKDLPPTTGGSGTHGGP